MRLVRGVDRTADLGYPQWYPEVLEQRERKSVLVAVERAVRLADDHGVKAAIGVPEFGEQRARLRATLPWDRP